MAIFNTEVCVGYKDGTWKKFDVDVDIDEDKIYCDLEQEMREAAESKMLDSFGPSPPEGTDVVFVTCVTGFQMKG